jgi:hypothetical protein
MGRSYDEVRFRNGYSPTAPLLVVECRGIRHEVSRDRFAIRLGAIIQLKW